jgi:sortase A
MADAADRGGSFGPHAQARNWLHAGPPGIAWRARGAESSPVGSAAPASSRQPRPPRRRWRQLAGVALLASVGVASLGHGAYLMAKAQLAQWLLHRSWQATLASGRAPPPWPWADTRPVARLLAPGRGVDLLVLAGASGRTLAFGPGHLDGSALPGGAGNAIITAHRDTHFRFLREIAVGDELVVETATGEQRHFAVRDLAIRDHRDLAIARDAPVPTLTLVTCYPFDALTAGGPLRLVVTAEAVSGRPAQDARPTRTRI